VTFALRGIAVSLSIFVMAYSALSLLVSCSWRRLRLYSQEWPARNCADLLFFLRIIPLIVASAVTLAFAVPSFLLLEPRAVNEPIGAAPLVLSLCGMAALQAGMWNAVVALIQVSRTAARWSIEARVIGARAVDSKRSVSVLGISGDVPPLTAMGILRPAVWLSGAAEFVLTERELQSALRHEVVHLRRRDNLRKLILRLVAFPGMAELEGAWREASEMAADDSAVSSASEALDLAAAVIKLSRLAPLDPPAELTTALVHSPAESVNARVQRLIAWRERQQRPSRKSHFVCALCASIALLGTLAVSYSELLVRMHATTEWLVR
jgi:beta-lactamase regulating signal transducer with metallopeptidase domain